MSKYPESSTLKFTPSQIRAWFILRNSSLTQWAHRKGFTPQMVHYAIHKTWDKPNTKCELIRRLLQSEIESAQSK